MQKSVDMVSISLFVPKTHLENEEQKHVSKLLCFPTFSQQLSWAGLQEMGALDCSIESALIVDSLH